MDLPSGCMSDYLESNLLQHIFMSSSYSKPSTIAICLSSGIPNDTMTGSNFMEFQNSGGYARQTLSPSDTNWSQSNGVMYNLVEIDFPVATAVWGDLSGVILSDNSSYGAGNILFYSLSNPSQFITVSNQFIIPVSGVQIRLD